MKKFKKLSSQEPVIRQIQDNIEQAINPVLDKAILDGVYLKSITLSTGSVDKINHKLGRTPLGYIVVKRNANSVIYDSAMDSKTISLNCSANVTISLWVF